MFHAPFTLLESPITSTDHCCGLEDAAVTLLEYGDFDSLYSRQAYLVVKELRVLYKDVLRVVFRHNPRSYDRAPAELQAEAAEAAAAQGRFWEMHDILYETDEARDMPNLVRLASTIGLDTELFSKELREHTYRGRVHASAATGIHSVLAMPTFFLNGVRFDDTPDLQRLEAAIEVAAWNPRGEQRTVHAETAGGPFIQRVCMGAHEIRSDLPSALGGTEQGPAPHDLLGAAVASSTCMAIQYAAQRRGWSVTRVATDVRQVREGAAFKIRRAIVIEGVLDRNQREILLSVAMRCPVTVTLTSHIEVTTELLD